MFYRIVLQGCVAGDHDPATVKREFVRVTGMPEDVTERLFAQTPRPLKERVAQADAERIAVTLRAIGAAVTVEHDRLASLVNVGDGVRELLPPDHRGPPTVVPGAEPAAVPAPPTTVHRVRRRLRPFLPFLLGTPLVVGALVVLAPFVDEALVALHPSQTGQSAPVTQSPANAPAPQILPSARMLHGPWRCTDQRTGLSTFWTFGVDGALSFHGDIYKEGTTPIDDPDVATGWQLAGDQLVFTFAQKSPARYKTSDVNISRLRYGDGRDVEVQCRRP